MKFVLLDFETESACDLKKSGAWRYSEDPTTNIICLGYTLNGGRPYCLIADDLQFDNTDPEFQIAVEDPDCFFIAHNTQFEIAIWRNIMMPVFGWPDIPNERWHCTQAVCAMKGLPLKLERAAMALRLAVQKDTDGTKATLAYGRPNKAGYLVQTPEKLQRVVDYCKQDVAAELELHRRVRGLGADERKVWLLDMEINQRGVRLDMDFVRAAQKICDDAALPLRKEFEELTGLNKTGSPKFLEWLHAQGAMLPNLQKETINQWLGAEYGENNGEDDADSDSEFSEGIEPRELQAICRRPLEIRKILGSTSVKKLGAMRQCCGADGRARGLLQYHGAGPGRWAGRLLQPQNFPRPTLKMDGGGSDQEALVQAILSRDAEYVRCLYGEPIEAVASGLRHALIAAPGHLFEVGDFAKIECVIVLALAGQADTAEQVIKSGSAVYTDMAEKVFKYPVKKTDQKEYTIGKNIVLGCGFQMGWKKFKARYAKDATDDFCKDAIAQYREVFAPDVPKLWRALEQAAVKCVWDRVPTEAYGIQYRLEDGWLTCRLPSGRKLWYYGPEKVKKPMPWDKDDIRPGFEYSAWKMGQWKRVSAYGGLLTENVVQATARDLLVAGMFNAEREGHKVVLTVHDEILTEVPELMADAKLLDGFMCDVPAWARSLRIPVASETWIGSRYRK